MSENEDRPAMVLRDREGRVVAVGANAASAFEIARAEGTFVDTSNSAIRDAVKAVEAVDHA